MNDPVTDLIDARSLNSEQEISRFIAALQRLPSEPSAELVDQLLRVFDDETQLPDVMFDVVHLIERARPGVEEDALLHSLVEMVSRAPWWTETLLMRLLNNVPSRAALIVATARAPEASAALLALLGNIAQGSDDVARRAAETIPLVSRGS